MKNPTNKVVTSYTPGGVLGVEKPPPNKNPGHELHIHAYIIFIDIEYSKYGRLRHVHRHNKIKTS